MILKFDKLKVLKSFFFSFLVMLFDVVVYFFVLYDLNDNFIFKIWFIILCVVCLLNFFFFLRFNDNNDFVLGLGKFVCDRNVLLKFFW